MKKEITFDNYIAMCDRYEESEFHCGNWWPNIIDIKTKLEPKLEQNLEFLIWVAETADKPKTLQQKESRDYINKLLNDTLIFIDEKKKTKVDDENVESETIEDEIDINDEFDDNDCEKDIEN